MTRKLKISAKSTLTYLTVMTLLGLSLCIKLYENFISTSEIKYLLAVDLAQLYVMGQAVVSEINPYLPYKTLTSYFYQLSSELNNPHPSPYPPQAILLGLVLQIFSLGWAIRFWQCLCIGSGFLIGYLFFYIHGWSRKSYRFPLFILLLLCSCSGILDILYAQFNLIFSALFLLIIIALKNKQSVVAGLLFALIISIKPQFSVLALPLLSSRSNFGFFSSIACGYGAIIIGCIGLWGLTPFLDWISGLTILGECWSQSFSNYSLFSTIERAFHGMPLIADDELIWQIRLTCTDRIWTPLSVRYAILGIALSLASAFLLRHTKEIELQIACMMPVALLIPPIYWQHYTVLLIVPLVWLLKIPTPSRRDTFVKSAIICIFVCLLFFNYHPDVSHLPRAPEPETRMLLAPMQGFVSFLPCVMTFLFHVLALYLVRTGVKRSNLNVL